MARKAPHGPGIDALVLVNRGNRGEFEPGRPGVLAVSRQFRQEALPLYLRGNTFNIWLLRSDASRLISFEKRCEILGVADKMTVHYTVCIRGDEIVWPELLHWCQHIHSGGRWWADERVDVYEREAKRYGSKTVGGTEEVTLSALEIARDMRDLHWKRVESVLEKLRYATDEDYGHVYEQP